MKPKILTRLANIAAKLAGSKDYDPTVKPDTPLEYYLDQLPVVPNPTNNDGGKYLLAVGKDQYTLAAPPTFEVTPADVVSATGDMTETEKRAMKTALNYVTLDQPIFTPYLEVYDTNLPRTRITGSNTSGKIRIIPSVGTGNGTITDIADPVADRDAVPKNYVDKLKPFIATFSGTTDDGNITCDKTYDEILDNIDKAEIWWESDGSTYKVPIVYKCVSGSAYNYAAASLKYCPYDGVEADGYLWIYIEITGRPGATHFFINVVDSV